MEHWTLMAIATTFTLVLPINPLSYAWHENLRIDANKAAELYQTKPNDPAIVQWKNALQLAINGMGKCLDGETAISCQSLMSIITSNCNSHPNELLACNDSRIAQFPIVLKQAQAAQQKAEDAERRAEDARQKADDADIQQLKNQYYSKNPKCIGALILDRCVKPNYETATFEAKSVYCYGELISLHNDCQTKTKNYYYCSDPRLVGFLTAHNIDTSMVTPYGNFTRQNITNSNITGYENATRVGNETIVPVVPQ